MAPQVIAGEVWACAAAGDRAGDLDQVKAIAWALDPRYRIVDLAEEFARLQEVRGNSEAPPPLPRAIVGIGRHRLAMATTIRDWSGGRTRLIHIGRARGALRDLDYLVTTSAFPAPRLAKVLTLEIAPSDRIRCLMSGAGSEAPESPARSALIAHGIRAPWINVFIGGPLRGDVADVMRLRKLAHHLDRLAARHGRDIVVSGAPRTPPEVYDVLGSALQSRHYLYRWRPDDPLNPFALMARAGGCSVVTADSITMISQLVAAGHRVLVFPWRHAGWLSGIVARKPAKDVAAFRAALYRRRLAAELSGTADFSAVTPRPDIQAELFRKLRDFLR